MVLPDRPGMYVSKDTKKIMFQHSFGGRVEMKLGVDFKCCNRNTDTCKVCSKKPTDDYWHMNNKTFLCKTCMTKKFQESTKLKRKELKLFRVSLYDYYSVIVILVNIHRYLQVNFISRR